MLQVVAGAVDRAIDPFELEDLVVEFAGGVGVDEGGVDAEEIDVLMIVVVVLCR